MKELRINELFESACPPLSEDELEKLEALIIKDGVIYNPILTWKDVIVDGHNRYFIAKKHNIDFTTKEMHFESNGDAIVWIKENAIGQRNLNDYQRAALVLELEDFYKEKAKERQKLSEGRGVKKGKPTLADVKKGEVRDQLADKAGLSHGTIDKVKFIQANADDDTKSKLKQGKVSVNKAYNDIKPPKENPDIDILESAAKSLENWAKKNALNQILFEFIPKVREIINEIRDKKANV
jgi:hypothetical protein